jgi:hypothetical protein
MDTSATDALSSADVAIAEELALLKKPSFFVFFSSFIPLGRFIVNSSQKLFHLSVHSLFMIPRNPSPSGKIKKERKIDHIVPLLA